MARLEMAAHSLVYVDALAYIQQRSVLIVETIDTRACG
jgi:hypothetical protein